jgi:CheY-like chemotaxis protein
MGKDNVELKLHLDVPDEELIINTDSQRIKQIFTNLLSNALKFTEKGFVEFGYRLQEEGFILFYVKDTGMGINKEKLRYVFDRFTKVSANKTKLYGGTGLGLSITKHLVEYLGGEIWVESEENIGSTFKFTHPFEKQQVNIRYEEHLPVPDISELLKGISVLVAEDEEINFLFLKETLTQAGADVDWAKNGQEAVEKAKESDYDLVLMDMKMPVLDGYDATKTIKKYNPDIPIIAQTAYALPDEQQLGYEAGCDDYMSKPIDPIRLISLIQRILNR